jgi:hypothetical protein
MQIEIKDGSNSTATLYVDFSTGCGFSLSWQDAPPQKSAQNKWDCVGFYAMHTFLAHQLRAIPNHFKPLTFKLSS